MISITIPHREKSSSEEAGHPNSLFPQTRMEHAFCKLQCVVEGGMSRCVIVFWFYNKTHPLGKWYIM
jgi:hypothetical protein